MMQVGLAMCLPFKACSTSVRVNLLEDIPCSASSCSNSTRQRGGWHDELCWLALLLGYPEL
jgi:hypothetical protein